MECVLEVLDVVFALATPTICVVKQLWWKSSQGSNDEVGIASQGGDLRLGDDEPFVWPASGGVFELGEMPDLATRRVEDLGRDVHGGFRKTLEHLVPRDPEQVVDVAIAFIEDLEDSQDFRHTETRIARSWPRPTWA